MLYNFLVPVEWSSRGDAADDPVPSILSPVYSHVRESMLTAIENICKCIVQICEHLIMLEQI